MQGFGRPETHSNRNRLALTICAALSMHFGTAFADIVKVGACTQASLRAAVQNAQPFDVIDLSHLTKRVAGCANSRISLTTGALEIMQSSLTLVGPSDGSFIISVHDYDTGYDGVGRVIDHTGKGTLVIDNLNITRGYLKDYSAAGAKGGCIYSYGNVRLIDSSVRNCVANGVTATGGGMYTKGYTNLVNSTVADNATHGNTSRGGGIFSYKDFSSVDSTISGNATFAGSTSSGENGPGGGVAVWLGSVLVQGSTFSGNSAYSTGGGLFVSTDKDVTIVNSTFTGNTGHSRVGGIYVNAPHVTIDNTTIASNLAFPPTSTDGIGLHVARDTGVQLTLNSTLISGNRHYFDLGEEIDLSGTNVSVTGMNNLVRFHSIAVPPGTLTGCPLLGKLADNGGPTQTMALYSGSPAIDAGNDVYSPTLDYDQRDVAPFNRVSGAASDIGAYELDQTETIFIANFEGCD